MSKIKRIIPAFAVLFLILGLMSFPVFADDGVTVDSENSDIIDIGGESSDTPIDSEPSQEEPTTEPEPSQDESSESQPVSEPESESESSYESSDYEESYEQSQESSYTETESSTSAYSKIPEAVTTTAPTATPAVTASASPEASEIEENFVVFGKLNTKTNYIGEYFGTIGIICLAVGLVGILCVVVWTLATRDKKPDEVDDIYETVANAQKNEDKTSPENPYQYDDNFTYPNKGGAESQKSGKPNNNSKSAAPTQRSTSYPSKAQVQKNNSKKSKDISKYDTEDLLSEILKDKKK
jgi:hypothetical protein